MSGHHPRRGAPRRHPARTAIQTAAEATLDSGQDASAQTAQCCGGTGQPGEPAHSRDATHG